MADLPLLRTRAALRTRPVSQSPFAPQLFHLVLAVALPLALLAAGLGVQGAVARRAEALRGMADTVRPLQLALDAELRITAAAVEALNVSPLTEAALLRDPATPEGAAACAAFYAYATELVRQRPAALHGFVLWTPDGQQRVGTLRPPTGPLPSFGDLAPPRAGTDRYNPAARWAELLSQPHVTVSGLFFGSAANRYLVGTGMPVSRNGRVIGAISATLVPESLAEVLRQVEPPKGWATSVVDQFNVIVAQEPDPANLTGQAAGAEILAFRRSGETESVVTVRQPDGSERYAALRRSAVAPWVVSLSVPRPLLDAPVWRSAALAAAAAALAASLAVAGAFVLGRRLRRDLSGLAAAARDGGAAAIPPSRIAEVAAARAALESATAALKTREAALAESRERLRLFVERAPAAIAMFDTGMCYLAASRRYLDDYRIPAAGPDALTGRSHYEIFPDIPPRWRDIHRRVLAGEIMQSEEEMFPREDGRTDWLRWEMTPWYRPDGTPGGALLFTEVVTARKEAELALAASEARFRSTFEQAAVGVGHLGLDGGWQLVNQRLCTMFGYTEAELLACNFQTLIYPEDLRAGLEQRQRLLSGEINTFSLEKRFIRKDGSPVWTEVTVALVRHNDGTPRHLIAVIQDIADRKAAEAAVMDSTGRLRLALDAGRMGLWSWDIATGRLEWDARQFELFGLDPGRGAPSQPDLLAIVHPEDRPGLDALNAAALESGDGVVSFEFRACLPGGAVRWIAGHGQVIRDAGGHAIRMVGLNFDVTERREAEAALLRGAEAVRVAAERVQLALSAGAIVGTWDWELPSDRFTVDERMAETFDIAPELGRSDLSLKQVIATVHPEDLAGLRAAITEVLGRGGTYSHEYRVRGRDGAYRWVQANGRVDLAPDGTPVRFPGVLIDIEARRALEAERDRAAALLRAFIAAVPGVVYAKDRDSRILVANAGLASVTGKQLTEIIGRTEAEYMDDPGQAAAIMAADRLILESGTAQQIEETVNLADGTPAIWLSSKAPFRNAAGEVVGLIGSSVDITDRKRGEERLLMMVDELNHRVKNTLATVQSIALQTLRGTDPEVGRALEARLFALALSHDVLTRENWTGADIHDVVAGALAPHADNGRFLVIGPPLRLLPRAAVALSMALHELATNALKYGALSVPGGRIEIRWRVAAGTGQDFELTWAESGGPPVVAPGRRGFGTRLIERSLSKDLGGKAAIDFAADGVVCSVLTARSAVAAANGPAPLLRVGMM